MKKHIYALWAFFILFSQSIAASVEVRSTHMTTGDGVANNSIRYIYQDSKGFIWMEKQEWKAFVKTQVKQILKYKPEAVYVADHMFAGYPVVHALRKKHIPVLTMVEKDGQKLLVRIPSGS